MKTTHHGLNIGDLLLCPDGWQPDGTEHPDILARVEEVYGPNQWPRVVPITDGHAEPLDIFTISGDQAQLYRQAYLDAEAAHNEYEAEKHAPAEADANDRPIFSDFQDD